MKYWKCSVCGFIHEGQKPPAQCPVCGAPREKFEALPDEEGAQARAEYKANMSERWDEIMAKLAAIEQADQAPAKDDMPATGPLPKARPAGLNFLFSLMAKNHAHPMAVHFPNGVLPAAVLFLFLSLVFQIAHLPQAAFYNLLFVTLVM